MTLATRFSQTFTRMLVLMILMLSVAIPHLAQGQVTWQHVTTGIFGGDVRAMIQMNDGTLFAAAFNAGIFRSKDGGATWMAVNNGLTDFRVGSLGANRSNGFLFAGAHAGRIFRSTDGGDTWVAVNTGLIQ
jgi:photosystem II stability/assembly factor-like uncharacterized protein